MKELHLLQQLLHAQIEKELKAQQQGHADGSIHDLVFPLHHV